MIVTQELLDLIAKVGSAKVCDDLTNEIYNHTSRLKQVLSTLDNERESSAIDFINGELKSFNSLYFAISKQDTKIKSKGKIQQFAGVFSTAGTNLKNSVRKLIDESKNKVYNTILNSRSSQKKSENNQNTQNNSPKPQSTSAQNENYTQDRKVEQIREGFDRVSQQMREDFSEFFKNPPKQTQPTENSRDNRPMTFEEAFGKIPSAQEKTQSAEPAQNTQQAPAESSNENEPKTIEEYFAQNPSEKEFEEAVKKNLDARIKAMEGFKKNGASEQDYRNFFEQNSDLFSDNVLDDIQSKEGLADMQELFNEVLAEAQNDKTVQGVTNGYGFVQYSSNSESSQNQWEMNFDYRKPKTIQTSKMYGSQTTYDKYDEYTNSALIQFDSPIQEFDYGNSSFGFAKDGTKYHTDMIGKRDIKGCSVKLSKEGKIDFTLPENKDLLSHPEVLANIIKMYPESFKTLPTAVYATDPKMFVSMYELGVKEVANNPVALGNMSKEEFYTARIKDLKFKTSAIMQSNESAYAKGAAKAVEKDFSEAMQQLGGE